MIRALGLSVIVACAACGPRGVDVDLIDDASAPISLPDVPAAPTPQSESVNDGGPADGADANALGSGDRGREHSDASPTQARQCTTAADCAAGFCVGGSCCAQPCDAPPACAETAQATCADGENCVYLAPGIDCEDGGLCEDNDDCDDDDPCTVDTCNAPAGGCQNMPIDCDDGDLCTTDACDATTGTCTHAALVCDDANACTDDACDPALGCVSMNNTLACDDADPCTTGDECNDGVCMGAAMACDDGDPCTTDLCTPGEPGELCHHEHNTAPCEDGDSCTTGDFCADGNCQAGTRDACGVGQISCTPGIPNVCACEPPYEDNAGHCAILPTIPDAPASCPTIATGTITVLGQQVELWVGEQQPGVRGPLYFYWHGTGGDAIEAAAGIGEPAFDVLAQGGVIASFTTTTGSGSNTGNGVWYTGDFEMADQILACAKQQLDIDTTRIYAGGCSAGGLQASAMAYRRSSYLAAVTPNSGGVILPFSFDDASHVPAVIAAHGAAGVDVVLGLDFSVTSARFANDLVDEGGFAVNCDHGGQHCALPPELQAASWQFLQDHPFGVAPEPYSAGLPAGFPAYCTILE